MPIPTDEYPHVMPSEAKHLKNAGTSLRRVYPEASKGSKQARINRVGNDVACKSPAGTNHCP